MDDLTASQLQKSYELIKAGHPDQAREILIPLLRANPKLSEGWFLLGHAVSDPKEKIRCFQRVLELDPTDQARPVEASGQAQPGDFLGLGGSGGIGDLFVRIGPSLELQPALVGQPGADCFCPRGCHSPHPHFETGQPNAGPESDARSNLPADDHAQSNFHGAAFGDGHPHVDPGSQFYSATACSTETVYRLSRPERAGGPDLPVQNRKFWQRARLGPPARVEPERQLCD